MYINKDIKKKKSPRQSGNKRGRPIRDSNSPWKDTTNKTKLYHRQIWEADNTRNIKEIGSKVN